jgi:hypothetical protein
VAWISKVIHRRFAATDQLGAFERPFGRSTCRSFPKSKKSPAFAGLFLAFQMARYYSAGVGTITLVAWSTAFTGTSPDARAHAPYFHLAFQMDCSR